MTQAPTPLPRITIQFCTQCKWMLRAAYFGQELLSTFGTSLGEVALQPATGGIFTVTIYYAATELDSQTRDSAEVQNHVLWDRKTDGGFPETKELKRRVRNIIDPGRDLGHVDGKRSTNIIAKRNNNNPALEAEFGGNQKNSDVEGNPALVEQCGAGVDKASCEECD